MLKIHVSYGNGKQTNCWRDFLDSPVANPDSRNKFSCREIVSETELISSALIWLSIDNVHYGNNLTIDEAESVVMARTALWYWWDIRSIQFPSIFQFCDPSFSDVVVQLPIFSGSDSSRFKIFQSVRAFQNFRRLSQKFCFLQLLNPHQLDWVRDFHFTVCEYPDVQGILFITSITNYYTTHFNFFIYIFYAQTSHHNEIIALLLLRFIQSTQCTPSRACPSSDTLGLCVR